ncbi:hypothetical protein KEM55_003536, partial [Ascosphaera atra]
PVRLPVPVRDKVRAKRLKQDLALRGVIFMVDAAALADTDSDAIRDAATYLHDVLLTVQARAYHDGKINRKLDPLPVLLAVSKQDLFTALPAEAVRRKLEAEIEGVRQARWKAAALGDADEGYRSRSQRSIAPYPCDSDIGPVSRRSSFNDQQQQQQQEGLRRERSGSSVNSGQQAYSSDGRPVLHYGRYHPGPTPQSLQVQQPQQQRFPPPYHHSYHHSLPGRHRQRQPPPLPRSYTPQSDVGGASRARGSSPLQTQVIHELKPRPLYQAYNPALAAQKRHSQSFR